MTNSPTLATAHGGFPAPVTILLAVIVVGFVLWTRMKGQPLVAKRLLVLPVVLVVIGITDLTGTSAPHLTRTDTAFLVAGVAISVVLGAARGATMELYPKGGELWQRYRPVTVALWIALIAAKLVLAAIAGAAGASGGGGTNSLLLTLGVSLLAEAAVVGPRALSTGVPFAADQKKSDGHRPRRASSPSFTEDVYEVTPPQGSTGHPADHGSYEPAPPNYEGERLDTPQWRSPRVRDGVNWLRQQIDQPGGTDWNGNARSSGSTHGVRHDRHDRHDRGLTGSS